MTSKGSDLAIRENMLRVIQSRDIEGRGIIHSSDFINVINDMGFPFGSSVVENILVHCKLDEQGDIEYSKLEGELQRERRMYEVAQKNKNMGLTAPTSSETKYQGWRPDLMHKQKVSTEMQTKNIQANREELHALYLRLHSHSISIEDGAQYLRQLGVFPTVEFDRLMNKGQYDEVTFTDFLKALAYYNPTHKILTDEDAAAGSATKRSDIISSLNKKDTDSDIFIQRKRMNPVTRPTYFHEDFTEPEKRAYRKMMHSKDQQMFKAKTLNEILFSDQDARPLVSHNQQDMLAGMYGSHINLSMNSELRVQREQVLAALRKLDSGEITMDDFQDKVYQMGFDLPQALATNIRRSVQAGRLDWKRFVNLLDAAVFKVKALDDGSKSSAVQEARQKFQSAMKDLGLSSAINLAKTFKKLDINGNNSLSFGEFKTGCERLGLLDEIADQDLRTLFNSFDKNGDGALGYDEFFLAVRGSLSPSRYEVVKRAFQKLDRDGMGTHVSLDDAMECFSAEAHPEVQRGERSAREVTHEFVNWFALEKGFTGYIPEGRFMEYYTNMSAFMESDEEFAGFVRGTWGLHEQLTPAPPLFPQRTGPPVPPPPAKQSHGDVIKWSQEPSVSEKNNKIHEQRVWRKVEGHENKNGHTDVMKWSKPRQNDPGAASAAIDEFRLAGMVPMASGKKNISHKDIIGWMPNAKKNHASTRNTDGNNKSNSGSSANYSSGAEVYRSPSLSPQRPAAAAPALSNALANSTLSPQEVGAGSPSRSIHDTNGNSSGGVGARSVPVSLGMYQGKVLDYMDDPPSAGRPSFHKLNISDADLMRSPSANWSDKKKHHLAGEVPFGRDPLPPPAWQVEQQQQQQERGKSGGSIAGSGVGKKAVMSLGDTLKAKSNEPKSLSNMLAAKSPAQKQRL